MFESIVIIVFVNHYKIWGSFFSWEEARVIEHAAVTWLHIIACMHGIDVGGIIIYEFSYPLTIANRILIDA